MLSNFLISNYDLMNFKSLDIRNKTWGKSLVGRIEAGFNKSSNIDSSITDIEKILNSAHPQFEMLNSSVFAFCLLKVYTIHNNVTPN